MESRARVVTKEFHFIRAVLLAWLLWLGVDFFAHAGIFAPLFEQPSPFLLPAEDLFVRIPLGYFAFLLYVGLTVWLVKTLGVMRPLQGAIVGAAFGAVITIAGNLALLSLSTIPMDIAAVWTGVHILEFGVAGYASAWIAKESHAWQAVGWTGGVTLLLLIGGVIAQNVLRAGS